MLNPFPQLLDYSFYAPTLLRVAVTLVLLYLAIYLIRNRTRLAALSLPFPSRLPVWLLWLGSALVVLDAFFLFIGYGEQWAALFAGIAALKQSLMPAAYDDFRPLARSTWLLVAAVCLSLLLTGAGAVAFDPRL